MSQHPSSKDKPQAYAGDISPTETFDALSADPEAVLVDCRTRAEWNYVGLPDLTPIGKQPLLIEWQDYPEGRVDPEFVDHLAEAGVPRHAPVYFLCRSGIRSKSAAIAATAAAYEAAYNIAEGFEGPVGATGVRDVSGWKIAGLPWRQT